jgi:hypothetical protein
MSRRAATRNASNATEPEYAVYPFVRPVIEKGLVPPPYK